MLPMQTKTTKATKHSLVDRRILLWPQPRRGRMAARRAGYGIHFFGDRLRQSALIQVEVIASFEVSESGSSSQVLNRLFQQASRFVEMEGVDGTYGQVNFSVEQRTECFPVRPQKIRNVIVLLPVGGDLRIDVPGIAIEQVQGTAVLAARTEDPLKRSQLPTVVTQHTFLFGQVFPGLSIFSVHTDEHPRISFIRAIEIRRGLFRKVGLRGERAEVGGVRGGRPGATEEFRMAHLDPKCSPAPGRMPSEKSSTGLCVHPIFLFQAGNQFSG